MKPYIIGIGGGTCSGKSTLARNLEMILGKKYTVKNYNLDHFYDFSSLKAHAPITKIEYGDHNHPKGMKMDKLLAELDERMSDGVTDIIIIEGLFALYFEQLRDLHNMKIFVDLLSDERLNRRINRNLEAGEALDVITSTYLDIVRYRHHEFVESTRWHADLVINGATTSGIGIDAIVAYVETRLNS